MPQILSHSTREPNIKGTTGRPHNRERTKSEVDVQKRPAHTLHPLGQGPRGQEPGMGGNEKGGAGKADPTRNRELAGSEAGNSASSRLREAEMTAGNRGGFRRQKAEGTKFRGTTGSRARAGRESGNSASSRPEDAETTAGDRPRGLAADKRQKEPSSEAPQDPGPGPAVNPGTAPPLGFGRPR